MCYKELGFISFLLEQLARLFHIFLYFISVFRYWVFRSWGRVGTSIGSNKLEKMPSKEEAIEHFLDLYEEKTGNSWHSKNFTKYPKKFYPLEIDYGQVTFFKKIHSSLSRLHTTEHALE